MEGFPNDAVKYLGVDTKAWKVIADDVAESWSDTLSRVGDPTLMPNIAANVERRRQWTLTTLETKCRALSFIAQTNASSGEGNWLDLIEARAAAVSYLAVSDDAEDLREELLGLAAYVMGWILDLDRSTLDTGQIRALLESEDPAA